ncbi:uncharacterized protein LOC121875768 isoform X2 [Homarus americanus]|uniref:uncharacterized protein LOC121875768 isoform X2 n=1 Tax=Homarus americanus TaxID=6706 RepID=UPI001C4558B9|nr:uncharacterized protein LOC121875768 isoform X2 [Homarus americanus]
MMQRVALLLVVVALAGPAAACKYWCKTPNSNTYECCDKGNPYYTPQDDCSYWCLKPHTTDYQCCDTLDYSLQGDESLYHDESQPSDDASSTTTAGTGDAQAHSNCYYYCTYDGDVYCCADDSRPIPKSHDNHDGSCPEEEDQMCKSSGIFLRPKKPKVAKTSGSIQLADDNGKLLQSCASDGYCKEDERCCASKCARKHVCLKSLKKEGSDDAEAENRE